MMETDENLDTIVTYTHEPGQFGPLLSENRSGTEYFHHYDALGSTTMLTDDTGDVTDTFQFDTWGNQVARTGNTATPYQWVGRWGYQYDGPLGEYYVRERSYQPTLSRWASVDPLWPDRFWQAYQYANNGPAIFGDASGMTWTQIPPETDWRSDSAGDTLEALAQRVSGDASDWVCIWPTGDLTRWGNSYPTTAQPCATADTANLALSGVDKHLAIYPAIPNDSTDVALIALRRIAEQYTEHFEMTTGLSGAKKIADFSGCGNDPIGLLFVGGHCGYGWPENQLGGPDGGLDAATFFEASPVPSNASNIFAIAASRKGPPKCWFAKHAKIYGYGCKTMVQWVPDMASAIVRNTAKVYGTRTLISGGGVSSGETVSPVETPWLSLINSKRPRRGQRYSTLQQLINAPRWNAVANSMDGTQ